MSANENVRNELSETESEEWDVIHHKDVQISGSSSDAESVEIISEEEAAQLEPSRFVPPGNNESSDAITSSSNADPTIEDIATGEELLTEGSEGNLTTKIIPIESNVEQIRSRRWSLENLPRPRRNSGTSESRESIMICLTLIVVGIAMLIMPEDGNQITTTVSKVDIQDFDTANLIKELQAYRESNEHLRQQVKQLSEVVYGLQNLHVPSRAKENLKEANNHQTFFKSQSISNENQSLYLSNDLINFMELINLMKDLPILSNITFNKDGKFNYTDKNNDNSSLNNESLQDKMKLFFKIPLHMNELSMIVHQHKTVQPFLQKWGNKLNKFSKSVEHDLKKLRYKFVKHILKNMNEMMFSFYRKLCKFQIDKVTTFHDCERFYVDKTLKKDKKDNLDNKLNDHMPSDEKLEKKRAYSSGIKYLMKIKKEQKKKIIEENYKEKEELNYENEATFPDNLNKKYSEQKFQKANGNKKSKKTSQDFKIIPEDYNKSKRKNNLKSNNVKTKNLDLNDHNNSEDISNEKTTIYSNFCKKGYLLKCNSSEKSASNWFINIGNQRSKLRSHQLKGDWLFDRAKARREKNFHGSYRKFHRKHSYVPPPVYRKPSQWRSWYNSYSSFIPPGLLPPVALFRSFF